ncbi:MAG: hypothetical protein OEL78_08540 [Hyphomicrobiales bacterium]|nr:hypothetical protein [Hyphomicrobiales bacterium]
MRLIDSSRRNSSIWRSNLPITAKCCCASAPSAPAERDRAGAADLVLASHRLSDGEFAARVADPAVEAAWQKTVLPWQFPGIGLGQSRASMAKAISG